MVRIRSKSFLNECMIAKSRRRYSRERATGRSERGFENFYQMTIGTPKSSWTRHGGFTAAAAAAGVVGQAIVISYDADEQFINQNEELTN